MGEQWVSGAQNATQQEQAGKGEHLQTSFEPDDCSRAIGAWSGLGGAATALGPFIGGYLIAAGTWRLIFLINAPLVLTSMGARTT